MTVIKVSFCNDLRRISLEGLNLQKATEQLKQLFSIHSSCGLVILHVFEDGSKEAISNNEQFQELVRKADEAKKILRLDIQKTTEVIPLKSKENVFDSPDIRRKLESIILETIQSKPFIDVISQKLIPYIEEKRITDVNKWVEINSNVVSETQVISELLDISKNNTLNDQNFKSIVEAPPCVNKIVVDRTVIENKEEDQEVKKLEEHKEERNEEELQKLSEEELQKLSEETNDSFVVVLGGNKEEKREKAPLLRSVLSFFKSFKKEQIKPEEKTEKTIPQEQLEGMLKQLNDMGFMDNEANTIALRFHHNFNEGLDAVIEDLLSNGSGPKQYEEKGEKSESLIQEKEEEKREDKGVITDEDVEKLMSHAHISKEAAIKALQSQLW